MFRGIHDRIALYKLDRRKKKVDAERERVEKETKEKKDGSILDEWYKTVGFLEYRDIELERKKVVSDSLTREADELHLPRPQYGDERKWENDEEPLMIIGQVLTRDQMVELRSAIRNEKRARRETVEWWVKIIGGLLTIVTGLVGALIGLISVWRHR